MANFLRVRNGNYFFRLRVPADLRTTFPDVEILKSLRTKDRKTAQVSASCMHARFLEVFMLSRHGFITADQANGRIASLIGRNAKTSASETSSRPPSLQKVIDQYTKDNSAGWTAKTRLEYAGYYKLILKIIGDRPVDALDRDTVRELRDTLIKLPPHLHKRYPNLSIEETLAIPNLTPMGTTTVNKVLTLFGSLMRHAIKEGYRRENPVEGLKVPQHRRADEERKVYAIEDLKKIVAALPSPTRTPERYWIPLIGMYSGMRLGEICGLHVADVKQIEEVWCFDVNEEGDKRLKTAASTRVVPVHPKLIEMGLLKYVESQRESKHVRLWRNLVRRESDGYCPALGNWYGRFNRKYVTGDRLKTFHSLRHTFANTLKQQGIQEATISELMGHANDSITTGRYGKRYLPKVLLEAIEVICYD